MFGKLLKNQQLCMICAFAVVAALAVLLYNTQMGKSLSTMANKNDKYPGESSPAPPSSLPVQPAMAAGLNSGPGSADGMRTVTSGVQSSCLNQQSNPADLLPNDPNSSFAAAQPQGQGELANINLLKAGSLSGIDTVGGTLRNANLQLRSEPPNPRSQVSPWLNSTIEPDLMRVPLELGCGGQ